MPRALFGITLGYSSRSETSPNSGASAPSLNSRSGLIPLSPRCAGGKVPPAATLGVDPVHSFPPAGSRGVPGAEGLVFLDQLLSRGAAGVFGGHGGMDLLGMVVDALAAARSLLGLLRDGAVVAREASGGVGAPSSQGYLGHGGGSPGVGGLWLIPLWATTPTSGQVTPGSITPSVKLPPPQKRPDAVGEIPSGVGKPRAQVRERLTDEERAAIGQAALRQRRPLPGSVVEGGIRRDRATGPAYRQVSASRQGGRHPTPIPDQAEAERQQRLQDHIMQRQRLAV
jgi:hypothetical protein